MPSSAIFGMPTTLLSRIAFIQIDAVISETHNYSNLVTEHPVEDGSPRTDNVVNLPVKLEMQGRITDTPSTIVSALASGAAGLLGEGIGLPPAVVAGTSALLGFTLPGKAKQAFQELVAMYETREVFDVLTGLHEYSNMVFTQLEFPRDKSDGRSIRFRAEMKELIVVGAEGILSNAAQIVEELLNTGAETSDLGQQALEPLGGE